MDSRIGLDYIVENADYTTKLGAGKIYYFLVYLRWQNILCESMFSSYSDNCQISISIQTFANTFEMSKQELHELN